MPNITVLNADSDNPQVEITPDPINIPPSTFPLEDYIAQLMERQTTIQSQLDDIQAQLDSIQGQGVDVAVVKASIANKKIKIQ